MNIRRKHRAVTSNPGGTAVLLRIGEGFKDLKNFKKKSTKM